MGTTLSKLFGSSSKKNNSAEPGAGQSATLPRPTTSKVKVDVPKKSSSFRLPFPKKSKLLLLFFLFPFQDKTISRSFDVFTTTKML